MDYKKNGVTSVTITSKEESTMEACINTISGRKFNYNDIKPEDILIEDIAHSLSNLCRFTGHLKEYYSVAQHSVLVSDAQTTLAEKRAGLLHDATEAYINDLPSPLKACTDLGNYKNLEDRIHEAINNKYNVNDGMTPNIKKADLEALMTEKRDLIDNNIEWELAKDIKCFKDTIVPLPPKEAKKLFMRRVAQLFPDEMMREIMSTMKM